MRDLLEALTVLELNERGLLGRSAAARRLLTWAWSTLAAWTD
jgi:hypothetical protein